MLARFSIGVLVATFASVAVAEDFLNSENGHYYRRPLPHSATWSAANLYAFQQVRDGIRGHLATITSASEQQFLAATFDAGGAFWIGGFQPRGSHEPSGNWQWITGEPFDYTNWNPSEPNNSLTNEYVLELHLPSGGWNDMTPGGVEPWFPNLVQREYIVEFTPGYSPALDGAAFLEWQRSYGRGGRSPADFDADNRVDADDLSLWKLNYGGAPQLATSVPEPVTAVLAITGLVGLGLLRASDWSG